MRTQSLVQGTVNFPSAKLFATALHWQSPVLVRIDRAMRNRFARENSPVRPSHSPPESVRVGHTWEPPNGVPSHRFPWPLWIHGLQSWTLGASRHARQHLQKGLEKYNLEAAAVLESFDEPAPKASDLAGRSGLRSQASLARAS